MNPPAGIEPNIFHTVCQEEVKPSLHPKQRLQDRTQVSRILQVKPNRLMVRINIFEVRQHFQQTCDGCFRLGTALGFENALRASRICGSDHDIDQGAFDVG
jgi:hypothetical protein